MKEPKEQKKDTKSLAPSLEDDFSKQVLFSPMSSLKNMIEAKDLSYFKKLYTKKNYVLKRNFFIKNHVYAYAQLSARMHLRKKYGKTPVSNGIKYSNKHKIDILKYLDLFSKPILKKIDNKTDNRSTYLIRYYNKSIEIDENVLITILRHLDIKNIFYNKKIKNNLLPGVEPIRTKEYKTFSDTGIIENIVENFKKGSRQESRYSNYENRQEGRYSNYENRQESRYSNYENRQEGRYSNYENRQEGRYSNYGYNDRYNRYGNDRYNNRYNRYDNGTDYHNSRYTTENKITSEIFKLDQETRKFSIRNLKRLSSTNVEEINTELQKLFYKSAIGVVDAMVSEIIRFKSSIKNILDIVNLWKEEEKDVFILRIVIELINTLNKLDKKKNRLITDKDIEEGLNNLENISLALEYYKGSIDFIYNLINHCLSRRIFHILPVLRVLIDKKYPINIDISLLYKIFKIDIKDIRYKMELMDKYHVLINNGGIILSGKTMIDEEEGEYQTKRLKPNILNGVDLPLSRLKPYLSNKMVNSIEKKTDSNLKFTFLEMSELNISNCIEKIRELYRLDFSVEYYRLIVFSSLVERLGGEEWLEKIRDVDGVLAESIRNSIKKRYNLK